MRLANPESVIVSGANNALRVERLPGTAFGIRASSARGNVTRMLQTTQGQGLPSAPAIERIEFGGAWPVTRLVCRDSALKAIGVEAVTLFAYSRWSRRDANASATPAIAFTIQVEASDPSVKVDWLFTMPNAIGGSVSRRASERHGLSALVFERRQGSSAQCLANAANLSRVTGTSLFCKALEGTLAVLATEDESRVSVGAAKDSGREYSPPTIQSISWPRSSR